MSVRCDRLIVLFKSCFLLDLSGHSIMESWKLKSIIVTNSHNNSANVCFIYLIAFCYFVVNTHLRISFHGILEWRGKGERQKQVLSTKLVFLTQCCRGSLQTFASSVILNIKNHL